jgi:hypothetical protein
MVIQVLETVTKEEEKKRERVGYVQPTPARPGTPDSVRCARLAGGELAALRKKQRRTTIIHRTVRCAPDQWSIASAHRTNGRLRQKRKEITHLTGQLQ